MYSNQRQRTKNYKDLVQTYYSVITEPYRRYWGDYFHPAIFINQQDSIKQALNKTHTMFIGDAQLKSTSNVIDLGCGIGSLSQLIAEKTGCRVLGINFSKFQLKKGKQLTRNKKNTNVTFKLLDIMNIDTLKEKFDAAFLIDVGCHLPNKLRAMKKIYSMLKKNGRLIIADWLQKENPNSFEKELLLEPFNTYWNFPYMESVNGYKRIFKKVGFTIVRAEDVYDKKKKNWDSFYHIALNQVRNMSAQKMIADINNPAIVVRSKKFVKAGKNHFYAALFSKICYEAGVFRYGYFVAEK